MFGSARLQFAFSRSFAGAVALALLLLTAAGCSKKKPEFPESEQAQRLVSEARTALAKQLSDLYGTVKQPHAPHWLPIERGTEGSRFTGKIAGSSAVLDVPGIELPEAYPEGTRVEFLIPPEDLLEAAETASLAPLLADVSTVNRSQGKLTVSNVPAAAENEGLIAVHPNEKLERGQQLFERHCVLCHGVNGDGNGPQSRILNPRPRDLRLGIFKYTSTQPINKASREDLQRVLKEGVAGTGMPAFKLLGNHEIAAVAEYVRYLALRGETERQLALETEVDFGNERLEELMTDANSGPEREQAKRKFASELKDYLEEDFAWITLDVTERLGDQWMAADSSAAIVQPTAQRTEPLEPSAADPDVTSLANGKRLYLSTDLQCASCHGTTGKGDGEQTREFQKRPDGGTYETAGLHDSWGQPVKPRDLTYGVFHGGRKPIDIYRRIAAGVKGTPMPAYGAKGLSEDQIWDLVNYIYYLAGEFPDISDQDF
ncbi:MAG: c-type cytochrome [Rubinisphaera brasiliensis]|uniref:c-type cytochrome n=1 Tax=Rubinisphaera brasiliensis TaxID=119 RepID=UPI00391ADDBA